MFRKQLSAEELKAVVQQLISAGVVSFSANDAVPRRQSEKHIGRCHFYGSLGRYRS